MKKPIKNKITFTKRIISVILAVALFDMQFPFILAMLGRDNIAEELGKTLVIEIVGVVLVYCLKSFFETREEENMKYKKSLPLRMGDITGFDDAELVDNSNNIDIDPDFRYDYLNNRRC